MATETKNVLDFQDPGALPSELMNVPGFVNELKNHTLGISARPNEPLAFAGALAFLAHLTGASYVDARGTHANLYLAALAPTGMGKDMARTVNKEFAAKLGILGSVPDALASGEGLEDAIEANPSLLLQCDEADSLFSAMKSGSGASRLNEMVLRLFSEANGAHAMRLKAGDEVAKTIALPHLTLFATGIPEFVYGALNERSLQDGLLGRCLFLETDEFRPLGEASGSREIPEELMKAAQEMVKRERAFRETGVLCPIVVKETPDATRKIAELRQLSDEISRRLFESDLKSAAALYCRLYEKSLKLAMLAAVSANPGEPCMEAVHVAWGACVATHLTKQMLYRAQFNLAEGKFDRLKKRALAMLVGHGGRIDRSTWLKNLGVDVQTFKRLVATLQMCDLIDQEQVTYGKTVYLLNNAA